MQQQSPKSNPKSHRCDIKAEARVSQPERDKLETRPYSLDSLIEPNHLVRMVWRYVMQQNLKGMYDVIKSRVGGAGAATIAPEILFTIWLYATLEGYSSAREIARLTTEHIVYRWICGGVSVSYRTLSGFRIAHKEVLDELFSVNIAALVHADVVKFENSAQDGMRVRASAGAASFRRKESLNEQLEQARAYVKSIQEQVASSPSKSRQFAAQERAAKEREARIQAALDALPALEEIKQNQGKDINRARASTTDEEATVMKMADGGFRPAFNVQFATDCASQVIIGLDVVTTGSDTAQLVPMLKQLQERHGCVPKNSLVDGGFVSHDQLDKAAEMTTVYAPVPEPAKPKARKDAKKDEAVSDAKPVDKFAPKPSDSQAVIQWRARMAQEESKELYKLRAATAECVNAQARNRGLVLLPVRGTAKVKCVVLLHALAHNFMCMLRLAPQLLELGTITPEIPEMA